MILPRPDESFEWRDTPFGPALVSTLLEPIATHFFTTRPWTLGGANGSVDEAWMDIVAAFDPVSPLVRLRQVHGRTAVVAEQVVQAVTTELAAADIIVSGRADRAIAVQAADCVPLLIADRRLGVVAAAHAGWRGLALGVPGATVRALTTTYGSSPHDLVAAVGPSVGACCYEVGPDVREAFRSGGFPAASEDRWFSDMPVASAENPPMAGLPSLPRPGHAFFDGWTSAIDQLKDVGIPAGQIACARLCTASHPALLCSYRRDGVRAGRIAGAIRASRRR
jgi:YfiH family protein